MEPGEGKGGRERRSGDIAIVPWNNVAPLSPAHYYGPHGGRTIVDCADELIARDRLIKTPVRRQRDPNAERQKYYSDVLSVTR